MKKFGQICVGAVVAAGSFVKRNAKKALAFVGIGTVATAQQSMAVAQDWSAIGTAVTTEIAAVAPVAMGIAGAIIAIVVGWKVFKRIAG